MVDASTNSTPPVVTIPTSPILDDIKTIGGDKAVMLARLLATAKAHPEIGNDVSNAIEAQLRTVLNAGVESYIVTNHGMPSALPDNVGKALDRIHGGAWDIASQLVSADSVANADQAVRHERYLLAEALVPNGVMKQLADVPAFDPTSLPAPAAGANPTLAAIQTIGGDKAVLLEEILATEKSISAQPGIRKDEIGYEENDKHTALNTIITQLSKVVGQAGTAPIANVPTFNLQTPAPSPASPGGSPTPPGHP